MWGRLLSLWLLLVSLSGTGCIRIPAPGNAIAPLMPWENAIATSSLLPEVVATSSVTPAEFKSFPLAFPPGSQARLVFYDDATKDVWVYPGAGVGIANAGELAPGQYYFDDEGLIYLYDVLTECLMVLVDTHSVARFAFSPTFDGNHNLYFIGTDEPEEASRSIGRLFAAFVPYGPDAPTASKLGPPCTIFELSKVNALGVGITSVSVTSEGTLLAFATECGELFLYTPFDPALLRLSIGPYRAAEVALDPVWGRYIAWKDLKGNWIYILDRWKDCIRPIPINELIDVSLVGFMGNDPWHVFFLGRIPGDPFPMLFTYDIRMQSVRSLTIFNWFANYIRP